MNELLKAVGLTALVPVLPRLLQEAQQTQPTYAAFLQQALEVEAADGSSAPANDGCGPPTCRCPKRWKPSTWPSSPPSPNG